MDKLAKVRKEVESRLNTLIDEKEKWYNNFPNNPSLLGEISALKTVLKIIDYMQKELVSMWHDASEEPKPNMEIICVGQYGNPLVLSSNSNSFKERYISKWAYFNDLLNLSNVQSSGKNWKEESVSDELEEAAHKYADLRMSNYETAFYAFLSGANWQKQKMMNDAIELPLYLDGDFLTVDYDFTKSGYKVGDKVKMIIIKED